MLVKTYYDTKEMKHHLVAEITEHELIGVDLDALDRAVINAPIESAADILQSWQVIAFRLNQQKEQTP